MQGRRACGEKVCCFIERVVKKESLPWQRWYLSRDLKEGGKHTMQIFGERAFEVEETGTK